MAWSPTVCRLVSLHYVSFLCLYISILLLSSPQSSSLFFSITSSSLLSYFSFSSFPLSFLSIISFPPALYSSFFLLSKVFLDSLFFFPLFISPILHLLLLSFIFFSFVFPLFVSSLCSFIFFALLPYFLFSAVPFSFLFHPRPLISQQPPSSFPTLICFPPLFFSSPTLILLPLVFISFLSHLLSSPLRSLLLCCLISDVFIADQLCSCRRQTEQNTTKLSESQLSPTHCFILMFPDINRCSFLKLAFSKQHWLSATPENQQHRVTFSHLNNVLLLSRTEWWTHTVQVEKYQTEVSNNINNNIKIITFPR